MFQRCRLFNLGFDMFFFSLIVESVFISIHIGCFFFKFLVFLVKSMGVDFIDKCRDHYEVIELRDATGIVWGLVLQWVY
jgi:hypothetical protein